MLLHNNSTNQSEWVYYFAYGSNMLIERMKSRIPEAEYIGKAILSGWEFKWNKISIDGTGKANIIKSNPESKVYGVIYKIPKSKLSKLDRIEGGYARMKIQVEVNGKNIDSLAYYSTRIDDTLKPSEDYKKIILQGAYKHHLPEQYIQFLENS